MNQLKRLTNELLANLISRRSISQSCSQLCSKTIMPFEKLKIGSSDSIAYRKFVPSKPSTDVGIIFCQGLMSNMNGRKARFLENYCRKMNLSYVCFDYMGHGDSSGKLEDFTIGLWKRNTLDVIHELTEGPQIIVGSSIGAWIMLLAALEVPEKIHGLVGIAGAPDFLYQRYNSLSEDEKHRINTDGVFPLESEYSIEPYKISSQTIHEAKEHLLLERPSIPIMCPVRLIHGMNDNTVPYTLSLTLLQKLSSNDVSLQLVKNGDHRMSNPDELQVLANVLSTMVFQKEDCKL